MERHTLSNGLNVLVRRMPAAHSVTLGLYVKAGQAYGDEERAGMTHFLEHLHFRRLGELSQNELYYAMERMGSTLRAVTYRDFLKFTMKIVPEMFPESITIFRHLLTACRWSREEFKQERQVVLNQITEGGNGLSLEDEMRAAVFGPHPLAQTIMGSKEELDQICIEEMMEYKKRLFDSGALLLCLTGPISDAHLTLVEQELGGCIIRNEMSDRSVSLPVGFRQRKPKVTLRHVKDDQLLEVDLSFDVVCSSENAGLLTILNCILGEGVGSRLQRRIREELCYSSDIASYIEWYSSFSVLHIRFSVKKSDLLPCMREVAGVLRQMKADMNQKDLDVSLPFYTTNLAFLLDDTEAMNFELAYDELVLGFHRWDSDLTNSSETIARLQTLAKQLFLPQNCCLTILGNMNRITKKSLRRELVLEE